MFIGEITVKCGVKLNTDMPYQEQIIKPHNPNKESRHRTWMKQCPMCQFQLKPPL